MTRPSHLNVFPSAQITGLHRRWNYIRRKTSHRVLLSPDLPPAYDCYDCRLGVEWSGVEWSGVKWCCPPALPSFPLPSSAPNQGSFRHTSLFYVYLLFSSLLIMCIVTYFSSWTIYWIITNISPPIKLFTISFRIMYKKHSNFRNIPYR